MPDTPHAIAEKGEQIYREKYRADYEQKFPNKFVAIDITTGNAFVADTPTEAILAGQRAEDAGGPFHVIKVGSPGVYRVGYSGSHHDWIFGR